MKHDPGKYDTAATLARISAGGSVLLIVVDGIDGSGFAIQATEAVIDGLPKLLREVADQIEAQRRAIA